MRSVACFGVSDDQNMAFLCSVFPRSPLRCAAVPSRGTTRQRTRSTHMLTRTRRRRARTTSDTSCSRTRELN
jgi:hypothetical protein